MFSKLINSLYLYMYMLYICCIEWQDIKSGDEDENIKKHNSIDILSPLNNHNDQYPSTTHTNNHLSPSHNHNHNQQNVNRYSHNHTHAHTHFVRSNHSNVHQLTPTNTKKNISNNIPLYSRGSGRFHRRHIYVLSVQYAM